MKENAKFLKCPICDNIIELIDGDVQHITCCGRKMEEMKANTTDAATEKHIPIYKKVEDEIANTEGYEEVVVNFSTLKLTFKTDKTSPKKEIIKLVQKLEPEVEVLEDGEEKHDKEEHNGNDIARIIKGINLSKTATNLLASILTYHLK